MARPSKLALLDWILVRLGISIICGYQRFVPRMAKRHCLLEPHCSEYARLALLKHGFVEGSLRATARVRRCRPGLEEWQDYP